MAVLRLGLGSQASGSLGGSVFSHNRFGAYLRARSIPVNPATDRQNVVRSILNVLATAWNNVLTPAERTAWDTYAANVDWQNALGDSVKLTGIAMYVRSNTPRLQAGLGRIDAAPTIFALAEPPLGNTATPTLMTQLVDVTFDDAEAWANEVGGALLVRLGEPVSPSLSYISKRGRFMGTVQGAAMPPSSPATFAMPWFLAAGQQARLFLRVSRADGRLSSEAQVTFSG